MARVEQGIFVSCLCLALSVCPSVVCQGPEVPQVPQIPPIGSPNPPNVPSPQQVNPEGRCDCPPLWARNLQNHAGVLNSVLRVQNNPLCQYIVSNTLLSPCPTPGTSCGARQNSQFCCCPFSQPFEPLRACYTNVAPNVCIPTDISPWSTGLYSAFVNTSFGKR